MKLPYILLTKNIYSFILGLLFFCFTPAICLSNNIQTALEAFQSGDLEKAQQVIDATVPKDSDANSAQGWYYRGVIYEQLMRKNITSDLSPHYLEEALTAYRKTLLCSKTQPQYYRFAEINLEKLWKYYINRSVQYYKMEYFEEALKQLEIVKRINPAADLIILYTAIINHQIEDYTQALDGYIQYLTCHSQDASLYRILAALTISHQGDIDKAQELFQVALKKYPWDYNLLEDYYELLADNQLLHKQQHYLDSQLITNANNAIYYYQLAHLHYKLDHYGEAIEYAKKALYLAPSQPEVILQIATIYYNFAAKVLHNTLALSEEEFQQQNKQEIQKCNTTIQEAIIYLKRARKANPKNLYILQQLRMLYKWSANDSRAHIIEQQMHKIKGGTKLIEDMEEEAENNQGTNSKEICQE